MRPDAQPKPRRYHKVGDDIAYRHGPVGRQVEGYGRIIAFDVDGCTVEAPDGRRSTVRHAAIVPPAHDE